jgi:hypothetical protein
MTNEIIVSADGSKTVCGRIAHLLWNYGKGDCFPQIKCSKNNFYVLAFVELPQGFRWEIVAGQETREGAEKYMTQNRVLVDVTNAPKA